MEDAAEAACFSSVEAVISAVLPLALSFFALDLDEDFDEDFFLEEEAAFFLDVFFELCFAFLFDLDIEEDLLPEETLLFESELELEAFEELEDELWSLDAASEADCSDDTALESVVSASAWLVKAGNRDPEKASVQDSTKARTHVPGIPCNRKKSASTLDNDVYATDYSKAFFAD